MELLQCIFEKNPCYLAGKNIKPQGIVVHATGANNPWLCRYVQPHANQTAGLGGKTATELLALLGKNRYGNDWNRGDLSVCVNAFLGKLDDGSLAAVQTLPWDMRPWGVGSGKNGSYNNSHIQFEICEDDLTDAAYCKEAFELAAQLCARLCSEFDIKESQIVSHHEAYQRGYGSGHTDPDNWWPKHGLSMDKFRARVRELLAGEQIYRIRKAWDDPKSQIGAYRNLDYAKADCKPGYTVFDKDGKAVYSLPADNWETPKAEDGVKIDPAKNYSKEMRGAYLVAAKAGLHLRAGAGTDQQSVVVMPYAAKVHCYGFYTGNWLNVSYHGQDGYCHKEYLKKMETASMEKPVCHSEEAQPTWQ